MDDITIALELLSMYGVTSVTMENESYDRLQEYLAGFDRNGEKPSCLWVKNTEIKRTDPYVPKKKAGE